MAARRVTQSSVNWSSLAERVSESQRTSFIAFKTKSDKYLRSVTANPEAPPAINWSHYEKHIAIPGLVQAFKGQYEGTKIAYPADNYTKQVDAQEAEVKKEIEQFVQTSEARIAAYKKEIDHLKSLLPFDQMTLEDFRDAFPDQALDAINKPTFWPHNPEEQVEEEKKDDHH